MVFGAIMSIGTIWFVTDINEDSTVTTLNETLRATAISEVDLSSRVDPGHVYINQDGHANIIDNADADDYDFESEMLTRIAEKIDSGSIVRFDYAPIEEQPEIIASAYEYTVSDDGVGTWSVWDGVVDDIEPISVGESLEGIRVRIRRASDSSTARISDQRDSDYWSYQSTVEVNRSDRVMDQFTIVE